MRMNLAAAILMTLLIILAPFISKCIHKDTSANAVSGAGSSAEALFPNPPGLVP
jgi:hypothetical protein